MRLRPLPKYQCTELLLPEQLEGFVRRSLRGVDKINAVSKFEPPRPKAVRHIESADYAIVHVYTVSSRIAYEPLFMTLSISNVNASSSSKTSRLARPIVVQQPAKQAVLH